MGVESGLFPFEQILVGLTASSADEELLNYALVLRGVAREARFRFVHVLGAYSDTDGRLMPASADEAFDRISSSVRRWFPEQRDGAAVTCQVVEGPRIDRLLEFAVRERIDLILVGHRPGRTGRRSMGRRLAMKAPCSLWLVPAGAPPEISRVMAATDFSDHSAYAVSVAAKVSASAGLARCWSLNVYFNDLTIGLGERNEAIREIRKAEFQEFLHPLDLRGVCIEPIFEESFSVAGAISVTARRVGADLVVMGTRGRSPSAAVLLGSESEQVMMESRVAVLIVKPPGERHSLLQVLLGGKLRTEAVAIG